MFDNLDLLRFTLLSGLVGFGVFCASYALLVWNRRNAALDRQRDPALGRIGGFQRMGAVLLVAGACLWALGWTARAVVEPEGKLRGDELFAVRSRPDATLDMVNQADLVRGGDLLARFNSPTIQAEIDENRAAIERLKAEQATLALEPLEIDAELVRRHEDAISDRRALRDSLRHLVPAHAELVRDGLQDDLRRHENVVELQTNIEWYRNEIKQAALKRDYNSQQLMREEALAAKSAASSRDVDLWRREAGVQSVDVEKMAARVEGIEAHQNRFRQSIEESIRVNAEQSRRLETEIAATKEQLTDVLAEEDRLAGLIAADTKRAERHRTFALAQLEHEIAESRAKARGAEESLVVRAPHAGRIVYRSLSPQAVHEEGPLVILGPEEGYRMRLRLPKSQLVSLQKADPLLIELDYTHQIRTVRGEYRGCEELPLEPAFVLAELNCILPHESARLLAENQNVTATLAWQPPLLTLWPCQFGALLAVCGAASLFGARRIPNEIDRLKGKFATRIQKPRLAEETSDDDESAPSAGDEHVELGQAGRMLEMLGTRLRTALDQGDVSPELLGAVEWALDRHQARAVRVLGDCLDESGAANKWDDAWDGPLENELDQVTESHATLRTDAERVRRILRVLRPVGPDFVLPENDDPLVVPLMPDIVMPEVGMPFDGPYPTKA